MKCKKFFLKHTWDGEIEVISELKRETGTATFTPAEVPARSETSKSKFTG